jgi:hypothetical protein
LKKKKKKKKKKKGNPLSKEVFSTKHNLKDNLGECRE